MIMTLESRSILYMYVVYIVDSPSSKPPWLGREIRCHHHPIKSRQKSQHNEYYV